MIDGSRPSDANAIRILVRNICHELAACAAGYWRLDRSLSQLRQVAFVPGPALDADVADRFAEATRSVMLSQRGLGIVVAAVSGEAAVSRVSELPADSGSGAWLRAFGASRSVAVPDRDEHGELRGVLAVALPESCLLDDAAVADRISEACARN